MKKKFLLTMLFTAVAAVGVIVVSCQKERAPGELLDLDMSNISMMTPGQQAVFDEATRRLDKHISFDADDGQYVMKTGLTAAKVGLSKRLFDYFQRNFETTNMQLLQQKAQGYVAVEVSKNCLIIIDSKDGFDIHTKGGLDDPYEFEKGGRDYVEISWVGYSLYISNSTLLTLGMVSQGLAIGSRWIPQPIISNIVGTITEGGALGCTAAAAKYPNGIVVTVIVVPVSIKPQ